MRSLMAAACSHQRLALSVLWAVCALAAPASAIASVQDCDAYSQADRLTCLGKAAAASEVELTQARTALASAIDRWDEDAKYKAAARRQLDAADQAFAKHRTAHCKLQQALGGGAVGNGLEMRRLLCVGALNTARAAQLSEMAKGLPQR
ncbi:lysozyme inhibitor LprI family protein [Paracidovorax sp. MALMAid1276]|uniref:lysozyme inhibitor LprI family protein n=1 Tax=Paracidovorax sp. MALMAid1276 TaxID=3411631 RepID=UPI003B992AE6